MRTTPVRMDLPSPQAAAVMRLLAVLVVLVAVGGPLMWGVAQVAVHGGGDPVVGVDGPPVEAPLAEHTPSPATHAV